MNDLQALMRAVELVGFVQGMAQQGTIWNNGLAYKYLAEAQEMLRKAHGDPLPPRGEGGRFVKKEDADA